MKITLSLKDKQPQTPEELFKSAEISRKTLYERKKLLIKNKLIKVLPDNRWALWDYELLVLWQPQSGEIKLCIDALDTNGNPEMRKANLSVLRTILHSEYWDNELEDFFIKALDSPEAYEEVIDRLLRAEPRNRERIELFFRSKRDKIYDLVKISGRLSSLALRIYVDVSDGREALDRMEEALDGEEAERVLMAAQGYGQKFYEKFNFDFKKFLHKALVHENENVRQYASDLMSETYYI